MQTCDRDEILAPDSDPEQSSKELRRRWRKYNACRDRYHEGQKIVMLSTVLRGPFTKNPWRRHRRKHGRESKKVESSKSKEGKVVDYFTVKKSSPDGRALKKLKIDATQVKALGKMTASARVVASQIDMSSRHQDTICLPVSASPRTRLQSVEDIPRSTTGFTTHEKPWKPPQDLSLPTPSPIAEHEEPSNLSSNIFQASNHSAQSPKGSQSQTMTPPGDLPTGRTVVDYSKISQEMHRESPARNSKAAKDHFQGFSPFELDSSHGSNDEAMGGLMEDVAGFLDSKTWNLADELEKQAQENTDAQNSVMSR